MNRPCKILVVSSRSLSALAAMPQLEDPSWEDEWEEMVLEEGLELTDNAPPRDSYGENEALPPKALSTTLTSIGILSREEDGSIRISYEDSEITGLQGCLTTFCLSPTGMLILLRRGPVKTCMVFENAHRHLCDYGVADGIASVVLHTHSLISDLTENGGEIFVDYSVEMRGCLTERNRLTLKVEPFGKNRT